MNIEKELKIDGIHYIVRDGGVIIRTSDLEKFIKHKEETTVQRIAEELKKYRQINHSTITIRIINDVCGVEKE
jgi:hypothetical protein